MTLPAFSVGLVLATAAGLPVNAFGDEEAVAGQAIVQLESGADIDAFNLRHQTTTLLAIASRNIFVLDLPDMPPDAEEDFIDDLEEEDEQVLWAEQNYTAEAMGGSGRDFYFGAQPNAAPYRAASSGVTVRPTMPRMPDAEMIRGASKCAPVVGCETRREPRPAAISMARRYRGCATQSRWLIRRTR